MADIVSWIISTSQNYFTDLGSISNKLSGSGSHCIVLLMWNTVFHINQ